MNPKPHLLWTLYALAFACLSFKLAPHTIERRKRVKSNESASWILEMCIIFVTLTWPENPADAISEVLNSNFSWGVCPRTPLKEHASAHCTALYMLPYLYSSNYPILATTLFQHTFSWSVKNGYQSWRDDPFLCTGWPETGGGANLVHREAGQV